MGEKFASTPTDFSHPEQMPSDDTEAKEWQEANRAFWEENPMRYDWRVGVAKDEFSREFFEEIDRRFFASAWTYLPWRQIPFDTLIDFDHLKTKRVLEIGVGMGSHAQLFAERCGSYTGIDLTEYAVQATQTRLRLHGLRGDVRRMDAEKMTFEDSTFDYIWSWGVIHHSSNTDRILREMARVLRADGRATVMVYHRGWWNYYLCGAMLHGVIRGEFSRAGSLAEVVQRNTDGALARYYSLRHWKEKVREKFSEESFITGPKTDIVVLPAGRIKDALVKATPGFITRFLARRLHMGGFLISHLSK